MRKRSSYRSKGVRPDTLAYVMSGFKPMASLNAGTTLRIKNHAALTALARGQGTRRDVDMIVEALNITEALARQDVGTDWADEVRAGQDALLAMATRGQAAGDRYTFKPVELTAVNLAMEIHDAQLDAINVKQLETALDLVKRVQRSGGARAIQ